MVARGTKPKPVELKVLEGNPGKRPLPKNTPKPQPVAPKMPRGKSWEFKRVWKHLAPQLERMGLLTQVDGPAFEILVDNYVLAHEAKKQMRDQPLIVFGAKGSMIRNPLIQIARDAETTFRLYAAEFGLTPSARSRLSLPEPDDSEDFFGY